jgi:hypothetical protein
MGVIDAINESYFKVTGPFDRLWMLRYGTKLIRTGTEGTARIDGIQTTHTEEASDQWVWQVAVTVNPGAPGEFRAGFRQQFPGPRERLHLGMVVPVRYRKNRVIVEWPRLRREWGVDTPWDTPDGWRALRTPPEDGVDDWSQKPPKGDRFDATIVSAGFDGDDIRPNLVLELPDGRHVERRRVDVPDYAAYLCTAGIVLPVAVNGDKVGFDWVLAANGYARKGTGPFLARGPS